MLKLFQNKNKKEYFEEVDKLHKEEAETLKRQKETRVERKSYDSSTIPILAIIGVTIFTVATLLYAIYAFVHATGISTLAGIHITPVIKKAANELTKNEAEQAAGKVPGYEDWLLYKNGTLEFMYPPDWEVKVNGLVVLKKYNDRQINRFDSLLMSMAFGEFDNTGNLSVKKVLEKNHRDIGKNPQEITVANRQALQTGEMTLDSGLVAKGIYWAADQKVLFVETVYYEKPNEEMEKNCQKVIDSIKFL